MLYEKCTLKLDKCVQISYNSSCKDKLAFWLAKRPIKSTLNAPPRMFYKLLLGILTMH